MDKLDITEINNALKDVRSAYRLLALYQKRLLDIINYIGNGYNVNFKSGWSKFSNHAIHGNRASINKSSWDWLTMYLFEFRFKETKIENDVFHLKIVHQADTGFYDVFEETAIKKLSVEKFSNVNTASTRLYFVLSKNEDGHPLKKILSDHLSARQTSKIVKGNWMAVPYKLERFINQESTDLVLKEFNQECKNTFGIDLMPVKV